MPEIAEYATPGLVVSSGALVTPGGTQGPAGAGGATGSAGTPGLPAYTLSTASMTIPAIGATTTVTVQSSAFANIGDFLSVAGAGGGSNSAILQITAIAGNTLTLLNPQQTANNPPASTTTAGLLNVLSGNAGDYVGGDNGCHGLPNATITTAPFTMPTYGGQVTVSVQSTAWMQGGMVLNVGVGAAMELMTVVSLTSTTVTLSNFAGSTSSGTIATGTSVWFNASGIAAVNVPGIMKPLSGNTTDYVTGTNTSAPLAPVIWSARLRTYNAIGNPTFEVDQRNAGSLLSNPNTQVLDRWWCQKTAGVTATVTYQQTAGLVPLPGTSFNISQYFARLTVTANQGAVAAGNYLRFQQSVEAINLRELVSDVHSIQLLVRSSVANLSFGVALQASSGSYYLSLLATIPTANVWTLVTLPNIAVWGGGTSWPTAPGSANPSYYLFIVLAAGPDYISGANGVWAAGTTWAANGIGNFVASANGSTFDIAYVSHEPGAVCTTPQDLDWFTNYDRCLRYYHKTYNYGTVAGSAVNPGAVATWRATSATTAYGNGPFPKRMAKQPTVTVYANNGAINSITDAASASVIAVTGAANVGDMSFEVISAASGLTAGNTYACHFTADTGW